MATFLLILMFNFGFQNSNLQNSTSDIRHPIHLCKTDLEYHASSQTLRISMAIFIDDLELALRKRGQDKLFIGSEREVKGADDSIHAYLKEQFVLKIKDKVLPLSWVGKEAERDKLTLRVYLEVEKIRQFKNISFENKILTEIFDDQQNILELTIEGQKPGYWLLNKSKCTGKFY